MASYFIDHEDVKPQIGIDTTETSKDSLIDILCEAVEGLWDILTDRTWKQAAFTEYHDVADYCSVIFLKNRPVAESPALQIWDDPDWVWGASFLIVATDYRIDYEKGILYYNSFFFKGKQSVKVAYTAGYTTATMPKAIEAVLIRQVAHWYSQLQNRTLGKSSEARGDGGTTSFKDLKDNLLPDFVLMAELNS